MRVIAAVVAVLGSYAAQAQDQPQPWVGYSIEGLSDQRQPWTLNWRDPDNEWLLVSTDRENATWYIQLASDLKAKDQPKSERRIWMKIDYSNVKSERAREAKAMWVMDCNAQAYAVPMQVWYLPNGRQDETRSYPRSLIIPGSIAATVARRVCAQ